MNDKILRQNKVVKEKEYLINKLTEMREKIQPLLYDTARPERNPFVQRANFIYALIFKIQEEYETPNNIIEFIKELEDDYPLASETIEEIKNMQHLQKNVPK